MGRPPPLGPGKWKSLGASRLRAGGRGSGTLQQMLGQDRMLGRPEPLEPVPAGSCQPVLGVRVAVDGALWLPVCRSW